MMKSAACLFCTIGKGRDMRFTKLNNSDSQIESSYLFLRMKSNKGNNLFKGQSKMVPENQPFKTFFSIGFRFREIAQAAFNGGKKVFATTDERKNGRSRRKLVENLISRLKVFYQL